MTETLKNLTDKISSQIYSLQLAFSLLIGYLEGQDASERSFSGNSLTTEEGGHLLINLKGVSISSKPRQDGRYQGYVIRGGKKLYFYGASRDEVTFKVQKFINERGYFSEKKKEKNTPQFAEYVESWLNLYKRPNLKKSSLVSIGYVLKPALKQFGLKSLSAITTDELQSFLVGMSPRMRELCLTYLNQIFNKAVKKKVIKSNPCDGVEIRKHKREHVKALTLEEQNLVIKAAAETQYDLLTRFLLCSGARVGEALALTADDVDAERGVVSITKNVVFIGRERVVQDTPKTEAGVRVIPIPKELCKELKANRAELFPFTYNAVNHFYQGLAKRTGVKITAHILRHTYATRLEEAGISAKVKQYLLGHSTIKMTQNVYTDAQEGFILSLSDRITGAFDTFFDTKF